MVARQVLATNPQVLADLDTARLGTAFFRRALNRVPNDAFDSPSVLPGWERRHVVAHVGYNARAIARLVSWAATGVETSMYRSPGARAEEIEAGASLRPEALRSLGEHAAIDLDVRWRDLPDAAWTAAVVTASGRTVPVSETLWMRSREVWLHAVDLDVGRHVSEIPRPVLSRLLTDVGGSWQKSGALGGLAISTDDSSGEPFRLGEESDADTVVTGPLPTMVSWATGRLSDLEGSSLVWLKGEPRPAPRWL